MISTKKVITIDRLGEKQENVCRLCNDLALCNNFRCYKKKQGKANCPNCDERLCQHHWRIYFRNNI